MIASVNRVSLETREIVQVKLNRVSLETREIVQVKL